MTKRIEITYRFEREGEQRDDYRVRLDPHTLMNVDGFGDHLPNWTALSYHQCPNCPLSAEDTPHCPAAVSMVGLVARFSELLSFDKTRVVVVTDERTIYSHTTMQRGVCSLMGLLMATSGCPLTSFFKPMARFHLPFASATETLWRATSIFLVAQYFRRQAGGRADLDFRGLRSLYHRIQTVNRAFAQRLRSFCRHDSMVNAIILLDMFAKSMPSAIEASLEEIRYLYLPYLDRRSA